MERSRVPVPFHLSFHATVPLPPRARYVGPATLGFTALQEPTMSVSLAIVIQMGAWTVERVMLSLANVNVVQASSGGSAIPVALVVLVPPHFL